MDLLRSCSVQALLLAMLCVSGGNAVVAAGSEDCQLVIPAAWRGKTLSWEGGCKAGLAEGSGVLRAYAKGAATEVFYGQMQAGQRAIGVIEVAGGYKAGNFVNGELQPTNDRDVLIRAFEVASAAAQAYSEQLQQAGNESSAKLYAYKAKQLAQQMD